MFMTLCKHLDGKIKYCTAVNNKYNMKNDRCQFIGGSNSVVIGNYYVDANLLLIAKVSSELIVLKDFASNKKTGLTILTQNIKLSRERH